MKIFIVIALSLISANSFAYTQCTETIDRIWAGDEGTVWFHFEDGGSFSLLPTDPDQKKILSMGMTALTTGNSIVVRYQEDNASCNVDARVDVNGIYLYGRKL